MKTSSARNTRSIRTRPFQLAVCLSLAFATASIARADQISMHNGDVYAGQILSMDSSSVTLQSDVLGTIKLPRAKIDHIKLLPSRVATTPAAPGTNTVAKLKPNLKGTNTPAPSPLKEPANLAAADKILEGATPEARAKFNSMVSGLLTGKLTTNDIRAEAKAMAAQVRAYRKDMDEDSAAMVDSYLAILDRFIADGAEASAEPADQPLTPQ